MRQTAKLLCSFAAGGALIMGCNVNLQGANLSANVKADVTNNGNVSVGGNPGGGPDTGGPGPGPGGPVGLQNVTSIIVTATTDQLLAGALSPFDPDPQYYPGGPTQGGPGPMAYPTPIAVGSPVPLKSTLAKFDVQAVISGSSQPVAVPPDDPGFSYDVAPKVAFEFRPRDRMFFPTKATPAGDYTLTVSWQNTVRATKVFHVNASGVASVVAE